MKQIFKTEMKRAMSGKGMVLSMLIGTVLGIAHVIREIIPAYRANLTNFYNEFPILSPHSAAETWMAGSPSNLEGFIFFLILPILASLPFGTSYFEDCKEGVIKNIYMRTKREDYLKAKYAAAFLSGGIAVLVPLIFNLMCSLVLLPNLAPLSTMGDNILTPLMLFYKIFFPLFFPLFVLSPGNALNKLFHPVRAGPLHFLGDVPIHIQGKGGGMVSQVALHRLNIVPGPERIHGIGVPEVM